ncbi:MAG TPA: hypothetical protein VHE59_07675 [Mucilaginibacter sp.]|nr:hypothetical protein [Mucilaginibacter sp.]
MNVTADISAYIYQMKIAYYTACLLVFCSVISTSCFAAGEKILGDGNQPQLAVDTHGAIRIVYGQDDKIYYSESHNEGLTFSKPALIAEVPGMPLGMSRGPQLASSDHYTVVTVMDKPGNIHWFRLNHATGKWQTMGFINDQKGSAPEGLMHIAADHNDRFYAVWLDIRVGRHNQICFASLQPNAAKWSKNRLVYQSPEGHTCECCQPHIAVNGSNVDIMFRNWLNGSRDLYLITSHNGGASFSGAQKLGNGTWKLNGCPMDGGGVVAGGASVQTTWQRQGTIYYCKPGQPEVSLGPGHNSTIVAANVDTFVGFQSQDTLKLVSLPGRKTQTVGTGEFIKTAILPNSKLACVWEHDNKIVFREM